MLIDLHCHTTASGDNPITPEDLVRLARERGLDGVAVTEHDSYAASLIAWEVGLAEGFPVFRGVEVTTDVGHILLFGLKDDPPGLWLRHTYAPGLKVLEWAKSEGVLAICAHPFTKRDLHQPYESVETLPGLSAIECLNGRCTDAENSLALTSANRRRVAKVGGSDCHALREVARCATRFERKISTVEDLAGEILAGRCEPVRNPNHPEAEKWARAEG